MHKQVKISKGLDIKLKGSANQILKDAPRSNMYAVKPPEFYGIMPRLSVKVGNHVKAGDTLFYHKYDERIKITSPVSGTIDDIVRGQKRRILKILIKPDAEDSFKKFVINQPDELSRPQILESLLESGLFVTIKQRPYDIIANPDDEPKAIYISALDKAPLGIDYEFVLENKLNDFKTGIDILKKLTSGKIHLIVDGYSATRLSDIDEIETIKAFGPHPVGNLSIHIEKFNPIAKGDRIWTINPVDVALIGNFFKTGTYNPERNVALSGSMVKDPMYYKIKPGANLSDFLNDKLKTENKRVISGNVLTGSNISRDLFLNFYDNQISVIPSGKKTRFIGWMPFFGENRKSFYKFGLGGKKEMDLDTNLFGEKRAFVMNEEFESVMPLDIFPTHLLKAALLGDVERMEELGILEVAPEDFALVDYISSSKIDAQELIRKGLDNMKEQMG